MKEALNKEEFEAILFAAWKDGYVTCMADKYQGDQNWKPQFKKFLEELLKDGNNTSPTPNQK